MYTIAFIIPVHNRSDYTEKCLFYLKSQKDTRFFKNNKNFIIVVDDGSSDGTSKMIHEHFPDVIVLNGDGNLWYSGSLNLGIRYALQELKCDFINVWENDIRPVDHYFNNLQDILDKWDGRSLISSKLVYMNNPNIVFSMGGIFNPKTGYKKLIGRNQPDGPEYQVPVEADWFSGQQLLLHKSIIEEIGYFDDKNFPQYHSDIDYALRARKAGYKNMIYPELTLLNDPEATGMHQMKNKSFKQFYESLVSLRSNANIVKDLKFFRKHTTGYMAYYTFLKRYLVYTGSFMKWKILGIFGRQKK